MRANRRAARPGGIASPPLPLGRAPVLLGVWLFVLFTLSSYPQLQPPGAFPGRDKVAHLVVYGVLGHLIGNTMWDSPGRRRWSLFLLSLLLGAAWGAFDETYQGIVPGRSKEFFDFCADTGGVTLGLLSSWQAARPALARALNPKERRPA